MGWNIEVACIAVRAGSAIDDSVPDVFGVTKRKIGFEDATSATRFPELCAAKIKDWYVVLDPGCRLTESKDYAIEVSAKTEVFVFRVSDEPIEMHYKNGKPQHVHKGKASVLRQVTRKDKDGELAAWDLMKKRTGLSLDDLFPAKYTVFEVD